MMYLIAQTWLFLAIACLIGMVISYFLIRNQKSERQSQLESEALDARHRAITVEKEMEEYRVRLAELEGMPQGARASRIAAREEVSARLTQLERELAATQASEKRLAEESSRLRAEVDAFRSRYLEARAKWDEYQAKAEALASAPQPLNLGAAQIVPDEGMRTRVIELEGKLAEFAKERERLTEQGRSLVARNKELERQVANTASGTERSGEALKSLQSRIGELEGQLVQAARDRDAMSQKSQQLTAQIRDLESRVINAGQGNDKSAEAAKGLLSRVSELEASLVIASRERDQASQQSQMLAARIAEAEQQAAHAGQRHEKSSGSVRTLQARIGELEGRLASGFGAARETDALRTRIADLQDKLSEAEVALSKSITTMRSETDPLRARISELESKLAHTAAAMTQSDTIGVMQSADNVVMREKLALAETRAAEAHTLAAQVESLERRIADMAEPRANADRVESQQLNSRIAELEQALEKAQRQEAEIPTLRLQIRNLDARLAEATTQGNRPIAGEDVDLLKARLADVESRLLSSAQSSMEFNSLRNRVVSLEALLHEAAKSRDEAAVLRSKVAELDGRLGQAMKAAAEAKSRGTENEAV
ncbi:MAG: hypothetical protein ABL973_17900 [Micropepsaceae bacterium]